ncbi:MAG: hypothetical protein COB30_012810 [Ectothiorhodospiraceae bacterium]|nr:hypothetical protein [Ectothiorhodospiraceae bacterium]
MKLDSSSTESHGTLTEEQSPSPRMAPGEIIIGTLVEINNQGQALVNFPGNDPTKNLIAISTLAITQQHVGRQTALLFANGDMNCPVILGMIHSPLQNMLETFNQAQYESDSHIEVESELNVDDMQMDGNKLIFEAKQEIVFKCGESSITLTKSGKIMIRGKYLLNRATGVNRIMGGSVQVN